VLNLQVRKETGEVIARGTGRLDWVDLQSIDAEKFPFLGSLLPYADTMFNSRQTERLRKEIADRSVTEILEHDLLTEIERLCRQVENGSHLYLWFVGD